MAFQEYPKCLSRLGRPDETRVVQTAAAELLAGLDGFYPLGLEPDVAPGPDGADEPEAPVKRGRGRPPKDA